MSGWKTVHISPGVDVSSPISSLSKNALIISFYISTVSAECRNVLLFSDCICSPCANQLLPWKPLAPYQSLASIPKILDRSSVGSSSIKSYAQIPTCNGSKLSAISVNIDTVLRMK